MPYHDTVKVWISSGYWADIDVKIAPVVAYLQTLDGVETCFSCQDSRADSHCLVAPPGPYVTMRFHNPESRARVIREFLNHEDHGDWIAIFPDLSQW